LIEQARESDLRVIAYRPDYIAPTEEESNLGHNMLHAFLAPINSAISADAIGRAMPAVSAGGSRFESGTILQNKDIISSNKPYQLRSSVNPD